MGRGERDGKCKRHPKHRESQGVCPYCLRERLSYLSASSSTSTANVSSTTTTTTASSSPYSSDYSAASPSNTKRDALSLLLKGKKGKIEPLTKSRSLAFVLEGRKEENQEREKDKERLLMKKKKRGFWSMLMVVGGSSRRKVDGGLLHSKTTKENSHTKWVVFS